jgi:hydroxypyruvate isomerase
VERRNFIGAAGASLALGAAASAWQAEAPVKRNGRIKQGITAGVMRGMSLEDSSREAARLGIKGYDFVDDPADWPMLKKYGLQLSMYRLDYPRWANGANGRGAMPAGGGRGGAAGGSGRGGGAPTAVLAQGAPGGRGASGRGGGGNNNPPGWGAISHKEATGDYLKALHAAIDIAAANDIPNIILLAGGRAPEMTEDQGAENAINFINQAKAHAEDKNIMLCTELISSAGGPTAYIFDHMAWGLKVMKEVNSPRAKILYDIYHAQVMDGNIVRTIRDNIQWIGHFHTGGVPGRHELDETQELNWRYIAQSILDLKYTGYITHEWSPTPGNDPVASLNKVIGIIDV